MIKSMTGFSRIETKTVFGFIVIEIMSINKRFLDINSYLPSNISFWEYEIRKYLGKRLFRGQVTVKIEFMPNEKNIILPNNSYLKNLKKSWEKLSADLGYEDQNISLEFLLKQERYLPQEKIKNADLLKKEIFKVLSQAIESLVSMKLKEGKALFIDIEKRVKRIKKFLLDIKKRAPFIKESYKRKLKISYEEIFKKKQEFEEKLLKELALFIEKIDITEEIIRLDSHIKQFLFIIKSKEETVGRKLEFLLQEFLREINTISSKALDVIISKIVIDVKAEIEKIKEQLQNIE